MKSFFLFDTKISLVSTDDLPGSAACHILFSWFDCKHVMLIQLFGQNVSAIKNKTINYSYML